MGVFDKIKNALFEVEYVEVDEPDKTEKKKKTHERKDKSNDRPIAKKVVLPSKEERVEKLEEEDLKDDDFEARPKDEEVKHSSFKFMDDDDFKTDDYQEKSPEIVKVIDKEEVNNDNGSYVRETYKEERESTPYGDRNYNNNVDNYVPKREEHKPYGLDDSLKIPQHEYGSYEREEKKVFKPSPIISPIYGILDKNYKKDDVVQKREVRVTSSYGRSNLSVDDVRAKALGGDTETTAPKKDETFKVEEDDDENLMVDLSNDNDRPEVKELTMGDALEYFQDLGLEYNVDYVDASKEKAKKEEINKTVSEEKEKPSISDVLKKEAGIKEEKPKEEVKKEEPIEVKAEPVTDPPKVEEKKKQNEAKDDDSDDNLFDLIDSMYEEKGD